MGKPCDEQIGEIPLEIKPDLDPELVEEFLSDAREQLHIIEQGALSLEKDPAIPEVIHSLFRAFHTFKGNAGFLDFDAVSQLAHALESLLDGARENRVHLNSVIIEIILKSRDTLQKFVDEIEAQITGKKPRAVINIPTAALKVATKFILNGDAAHAKPPRPPEPAAPAPAPVAPREPAPTAKVEKVEKAPENPPALFIAEAPAPAKSSYQTGTALHAVKVATSKLDSLVDLAGELLIAQSLVVQDVSSPDANRHSLARNLDQLSRISKELQRMAMAMRMVPIRATFHKMERLVRDIAAKQQKHIRVVLEGEETEVDRTIAEKLADPLMHMVRNSVDHAIEPPDKRASLGKHPTGTIHLRAYHKSGTIVLEVEDDGVGLNRERIAEKAVQNGWLRSGVMPDDRELLQFILQPGFSTAAVVTSISGRGVGMDVVQKNIAQLRGKIEIKSVSGAGTTFTIRLPLTLAIIDGLIIRVGGQRYIVPTTSVRESFHPRSCTVTSLPEAGELVQMRKELIPLLRLRDHFGLKSPHDAGEGIMIVIESDGKKRCLLADELVGKQEVVIKNLGEVFKTDPMVSGGAILGDGCVGLILDPAALVHLESESNELKLAI